MFVDIKFLEKLSSSEYSILKVFLWFAFVSKFPLEANSGVQNSWTMRYL